MLLIFKIFSVGLVCKYVRKSCTDTLYWLLS